MLLFVGVAGCQPADLNKGLESNESGRLRIAATNYPLAFFAERIGAEYVDVQIAVPASVDPVRWNPTPVDVGRLQGADLILINGANYEPWINLVTLPDSKIFNTTASLEDKFIYFQDSISHQHGPDGPQSNATLASTTWLDLTIAIEQAKAVTQALAKLLPEQQGSFEERFTELEAELRRMDDELTSLPATSETALLAAQPVYQYLARRCGMDIQNLQWQVDQTTGGEAWEELQSWLAKHPASAMLWPFEPGPEIRAKLEELGLKVVVYAPASHAPAEGDFLTIMRQNVSRLSESLAP